MKLPLAFAIDLIAVLIFAIVGRGSHAETLQLIGVSQTAWPFLVGTLAGTVIVLLWHRARPETRSTLTAGPAAGVVIWLATVIGGIGLRLATGDTAQPAFIVVATLTLAVLLIGWRIGYALIRRARHAHAG